MNFYTANEICSRMNNYGKSHTPFLFLVNFEKTEGTIIQYPNKQNDVLYSINGKGNKPPISRLDATFPKLQPDPISPEIYKQKYDIVFEGLKKGNSFLTNLTVKTPIKVNASLGELFLQVDAPFQLFIPEKFISFSPEKFVEIKNGLISTNPMKGTIDASIANAREVVLNDFKETAEHSTIVDLLRNDLSIVAESVKVKRFRYIDKIETNNKNILQVSSEIEGILKGDYYSRLGDIIFAMLPAGSVSGAPKKATLNIIKQAEAEPRGYYCGVWGYFDGEDLISSVVIRYIEQDKSRNLYFRSGGGVTAYSNWIKEYEEVLDKIYLPI